MCLSFGFLANICAVQENYSDKAHFCYRQPFSSTTLAKSLMNLMMMSDEVMDIVLFRELISVH